MIKSNHIRKYVSQLSGSFTTDNFFPQRFEISAISVSLDEGTSTVLFTDASWLLATFGFNQCDSTLLAFTLQ